MQQISRKFNIPVVKIYRKCGYDNNLTTMVWSPPFQIRSFLKLLASQYYIWSPKTVPMVRWTRGKFEFDQPYKQTVSKMQGTGRFQAIRKTKLLLILCKKKKQMAHTRRTSCQFENGTVRASLTLNSKK